MVLTCKVARREYWAATAPVAKMLCFALGITDDDLASGLGGRFLRRDAKAPSEAELERLLALPAFADRLRRLEVGFYIPYKGEFMVTRNFYTPDAAELRAKAVDEVFTRLLLGGVHAGPPPRNIALPKAGAGASLSGTLAVGHAVIFDVDLNDYDEKPYPLRACGCTGKTFCGACWRLLVVGVICLEAIMRPLLGTAEFIFSGGRGLHAWFRSPAAFAMSEAARRQMLATLASPARDLGDEVWARVDDALAPHMDLVEQVVAENPLVAEKLSVRRDAEGVYDVLAARLDEMTTKGLRHMFATPWCVHPRSHRVLLPIGSTIAQLVAFDPTEDVEGQMLVERASAWDPIAHQK